MTSCGYLHYNDFRNRILQLPFEQVKKDEWLNFVDAVHGTGWRTEDEKQILYCQLQNAIIQYAESINAHSIITQVFGAAQMTYENIRGAGQTVIDIIKSPISWITIALIAGAIIVVKLR